MDAHWLDKSSQKMENLSEIGVYKSLFLQNVSKDIRTFRIALLPQKLWTITFPVLITLRWSRLMINKIHILASTQDFRGIKVHKNRHTAHNTLSPLYVSG